MYVNIEHTPERYLWIMDTHTGFRSVLYIQRSTEGTS